MGGPLLEFSILVVVLLNGLFPGSERGVISARRSRLEAAAARGERGAAAAVRLAERPGAFLATVQIGITLIGTVSAVFAGGSLTRYVEPLLRPLLGASAGVAASVAVVLLVTFLSLVLDELAPRGSRCGTRRPSPRGSCPFLPCSRRWLLKSTSRCWECAVRRPSS